MTLSQVAAGVFFISYFLTAAYAAYKGSHNVKRVFALLTLCLLLGAGISGEHYWPFFDWHFMSDTRGSSATLYDVSLVDSSGEEYDYPFWETVNGYLAFPTVYNHRMLSREKEVVPTACYLLKEGERGYSTDRSSILDRLRFPPHIDYAGLKEDMSRVEKLKFYRVELDLDSGGVTERKMVQRVNAEQCS
jgi:hypothetical protein